MLSLRQVLLTLNQDSNVTFTAEVFGLFISTQRPVSSVIANLNSDFIDFSYTKAQPHHHSGYDTYIFRIDRAHSSYAFLDAHILIILNVHHSGDSELFIYEDD